MKPEKKTEHEIHELIKKRWSPRAFADQEIEQEKINSLFEAARWAASASNEQPWKFIYATKNNKRKYKDILYCLVESNIVWARSAPLLVLTMVDSKFKKNNKINYWNYHDLGLAIGNLTTQASSLDLYVHNMAGFSKETAKEVFNIPENIEPVTIIAIGYLGDPKILSDELKSRELSEQVRKPFDDLFLE